MTHGRLGTYDPDAVPIGFRHVTPGSEHIRPGVAVSGDLCSVQRMSSTVLAQESIHVHGHVILEKMMGTEMDIVNNARVSFDQSSDDLGAKERGLLNFLMENRHGSPWEAVVTRWDIMAPLFVIREFQRHRIASYNEQSARYSQIPELYFVPERIRSQTGKPGHYTFVDTEDENLNETARDLIDVSQRSAFYAYNKLLLMGVAKEQARIVLPVGMFSRMKVTINLRSLFNFLALRNHDHAQREIREIAAMMEAMVADQMPHVIELFNKYGRNPV